ncbi:Glycine-rich RNA-binding protein 4, mitochondrial [Clydaea vesicula]|uniref:Glycine-rich RNA-binding protein 4, mitochondrial n=1 Tax=Clydaea vesicula TaxID=447962 RepID=A0AAD5U0Y5_9FUNG|nr:Glycine-rich RNA-binding protein 4, mitochondrial [Clydaea vesicula]KAJ3382838.1 Glycine-rich RNA-binding protein 4, mitochondrial [Lobulomyces angularis]
MTSKVFVGNLSWNTNEESLRSHFSQYGDVTDAVVLTDRETGRSRGFGFVTFSSSEEAEKAVQEMNEQELDGRQIRVNLANERSDRGDRNDGNRDGSRGRGGFNGGARGGRGGSYGGGRGGYNNNRDNNRDRDY